MSHYQKLLNTDILNFKKYESLVTLKFVFPQKMKSVVEYNYGKYCIQYGYILNFVTYVQGKIFELCLAKIKNIFLN